MPELGWLRSGAKGMSLQNKESRGSYKKVNTNIEGPWELSSTNSVFYMWGNWGLKGLKNSLEVTKLVGDRPEIETQISRL